MVCKNTLTNHGTNITLWIAMDKMVYVRWLNTEDKIHMSS